MRLSSRVTVWGAVVRAGAGDAVALGAHGEVGIEFDAEPVPAELSRRPAPWCRCP